VKIHCRAGHPALVKEFSPGISFLPVIAGRIRLLFVTFSWSQEKVRPGTGVPKPPFPHFLFEEKVAKRTVAAPLPGGRRPAA